MAQIFISYSLVDKPFVEKLYSQLESVYGSGSIWYSKEILGGEDFWERICNEIAQAGIVLYLLSPESIASHWCGAEYDEADRLQKAIIPIIVRDRTPIPSKVQHINVLDMSSGAEKPDTLNKLYQTINPIFYDKSRKSPKPKRPEHTPYPTKPEDATIPDYLPNTKAKNIAYPAPKSDGVNRRLLASVLLVAIGIFAVFAVATVPKVQQGELTTDQQHDPTSAGGDQHTATIEVTPSLTVTQPVTDIPAMKQTDILPTNVPIPSPTAQIPTESNVDTTFCTANIITTNPISDICRISSIPAASSNNSCLMSGTPIIILTTTKDGKGFTWYQIALEENPTQSKGWVNENDVDNIKCR